MRLVLAVLILVTAKVSAVDDSIKAKALAAYIYANQKEQPVPKLAQPLRLRQYIGHTHTCPNPRCRYTWDHTEDDRSHLCPKCHTEQLIQDRR